jgi:hypothetical protein
MNKELISNILLGVIGCAFIIVIPYLFMRIDKECNKLLILTDGTTIKCMNSSRAGDSVFYINTCDGTRMVIPISKVDRLKTIK